LSSISNAMEALKDDFKSADDVVLEIYNKYFAKYFQREAEMYSRFQDTEVVITDKELEWIITSLPLELMSASDALAQFKQHNEIIKLTIKQRKNQSQESIDEEYRLMSIVYSCVISKVESKLSFSKELIMGAKKVWDARKRTEQVNPINEANSLPDYTPIKRQQYIHGGSLPDVNI